MTRLTLQDFTFSDGTFVPKGELISAAMHPMHHDSELYADPEVFNPWRFADLRANEGEELKHQLVSTNSEYITFGHGRHAWYVSGRTPLTHPCPDILRFIAPVVSLLLTS